MVFRRQPGALLIVDPTATPASQGMTKQEALRMLRLLSGLESAMLCSKQSIPDYLLDELMACSEILEREVLK